MATNSISSFTNLSTISELKESLCCEAECLPKRFRALFSLKHIATKDQSLPAIKAIAASFSSTSALLKHEVAYCLGQTKNTAAIPYLRAVLMDRAEDPMCRHEAAEAMGAIGDMQSLIVLREFRDAQDEHTVVRQTCELAIERILWENGEDGNEILNFSNFESIDPAPPTAGEDSVEGLEQELLDQKLPLFRRYRAMFSLRDLASPPDLPTATAAILSLTKGFADPSALFRHEIAFVFGQLSHPASIPALTSTLKNTEEASMVRHEAAEALGTLGKQPGVLEILKCFSNDQDRIVRESVAVALDMADYETSGQTEYALVPEISA
ncbi:Deoxyhypusine hydroxylase [Golovinomyces cichoracearum]|uniref:Deoxyhypusine hydroxylase n=1 Tax=Golovinomyces cichoracearum TaxID=62708 RepID=A0A420ICG3_9PEZI|nr:Deoxyhypusine hydroxylase [Golovinomyces cichoracearum]